MSEINQIPKVEFKFLQINIDAKPNVFQCKKRAANGSKCINCC